MTLLRILLGLLGAALFILALPLLALGIATEHQRKD